MKQYILLIVVAFGFTNCSIDDENDFRDTTDFSEDISNKTNFYMQNPTRIFVAGQNNQNQLQNQTQELLFDYKKGDTIKLSVLLNANHKNNDTDTYDIRQSTGASSFNFGLNLGYQSPFDTDIVDLDYLAKNPDIQKLKLTKEQIKNSLIYHRLYVAPHNLLAHYNTNNHSYSGNFGIVVLKDDEITSTNTDPNLNTENEYYLNTTNYLKNEQTDKNINIYIPILSTLNFAKIHITE